MGVIKPWWSTVSMLIVRSVFLLFLPAVLLLHFLASDVALAQDGGVPDTDLSTSPSQSRLPENHSPDGALYRSLAVPGWGQIYNRQYWKLPIVYAALGGITGVSINASRQHRLYTRAYQYKAWTPADGEAHPFPQFEDEYLQVLQNECGNVDCDPSSSSLKQLRDNFRRNRDLSRFGIGLVYGLSVIDAFVSAHLLDFDVSEDLTLQVFPHPGGATAQLRIGF